jgi:hypothetical protein
MWFTGEERTRHKRTEYNLPRLVQKGVLQEVRFGRKKVYSAWGSRQHLRHGLACTEGFIRFHLADPTGMPIAEKQFHQGQFGCIPEWGIKYLRGKLNTLLLYEYCTYDNATRNGLVQRKINSYNRGLHRIEQTYEAKAIVLFVLELDRERVRLMAQGDYFFTDYDTFLQVPYGRQLTAPIYFWGQDGHCYPLREK